MGNVTVPSDPNQSNPIPITIKTDVNFSKITYVVNNPNPNATPTVSTTTPMSLSDALTEMLTQKASNFWLCLQGRDPSRSIPWWDNPCPTTSLEPYKFPNNYGVFFFKGTIPNTTNPFLPGNVKYDACHPGIFSLDAKFAYWGYPVANELGPIPGGADQTLETILITCMQQKPQWPVRCYNEIVDLTNKPAQQYAGNYGQPWNVYGPMTFTG
jgi:hypothetical protein